MARVPISERGIHMKLSSLHTAIALWAFSLMLLVQGTLDGSYFIALWALMLGQVAAVCTCTAVVTCARRRVEGVLESEEHAVERFTGTVLSAIDDQGRRR